MATRSIARDLAIIVLLFGSITSLLGLGAWGIYSALATADGDEGASVISDTSTATEDAGVQSPDASDPAASADNAAEQPPPGAEADGLPTEERESAAESDTTADAPLSRSSIQAVVKRHTRAIQACYERQLRSNPKLEGTVVVELTIESSGRVARARITSSPSGVPKLGNCIRRQARRWRFPAFSGPDLVVSYPFVLKSQ